MTELPGGRLAEIIGGHRVFGYSMLSASVLTLLTPVAARLDYTAVVVLRVLLGLMLVTYRFPIVGGYSTVAARSPTVATTIARDESSSHGYGCFGYGSGTHFGVHESGVSRTRRVLQS